jgi:hypothetical protein
LGFIAHSVASAPASAFPSDTTSHGGLAAKGDVHLLLVLDDHVLLAAGLEFWRL